ncbi:hypothetical protein [Stenotrophomonas maltophilia]|uniref:hypothetical protein n=1 Tax=Stenotrophomonas maltophilia TaxID=40324 RepID=UPI00209AE7B2|nr:hypothetical protein [Stenotrophomonas maltophilia]MCO7486965.1 hypothetical protein [Stenotrophomonas maltophilia]
MRKWLADMDLETGTKVRARISARGDAVDLALEAPMPNVRTVSPQSCPGTTIMVHLIDDTWQQTAVQSNTLAFAPKMFPNGVALSRQGGPTSQLLDDLGVSTLLRIDCGEGAQLILNMPWPLKALDRT